MNDLISRQAAIDACIRVRELRAYDEIEEIKALPSAEPEPPEDICGECDAWNQYKQKEPCEDAVSRKKVIGIFTALWECIGTIMDRDEWEDACRTTANELPSVQPELKKGKWIPCSERLPADDDYRESMECLDGCVWYFTDKGSMGLGYYYYSTKEWSTLRDLKPDGKVIAWMPLPEPYEGE